MQWSVVCRRCREWAEGQLAAFLNVIVAEPPAYEARKPLNYGGEVVHVLQIGLGNFGTFLQQDTYWVNMLLDATSWKSASWSTSLRGIGVDPLVESIAPLQKLARDQSEWNTSLVLGAVAKEKGEMSLWCLPYKARLNARRHMREKRLDIHTKIEVDAYFGYLENMSSIELPHPDFKDSTQKIQKLACISSELLEKRSVPSHSFQDILEMHNCTGCELLVIDAEGADCAILSSMAAAVQNMVNVQWPFVIRFETMGHADKRESVGHEKGTVQWLRRDAGYILLEVGQDVTLVHGKSLSNSTHLQAWADKYFTLSCTNCGWMQRPSMPDFDKLSGLSCDTSDGFPYHSWKWYCQDCQRTRSGIMPHRKYVKHIGKEQKYYHTVTLQEHTEDTLHFVEAWEVQSAYYGTPDLSLYYDVTDIVKILWQATRSLQPCNAIFGDPAYGHKKVLNVTLVQKECNPNKFVQIVTLEEHTEDTLDFMEAWEVQGAYYGTPDLSEYFDVTDIVKDLWLLKRSLRPSNETFGDPAYGQSKVLEVTLVQVKFPREDVQDGL